MYIEKATQPQPIEEIIQATEQHFLKAGYADSTMHRYHYVWNRFQDYAHENHQQYLTVDICRSFMRDVYNFEMYTIKLSTSKLAVRRPILALLEFQENGFVATRCLVTNPADKRFPPEYAEIIEGFLDSLKSRNLAEITEKSTRRILLYFTRYLIERDIRGIENVNIQVINEYAVYLTGYSKAYLYAAFSKIKQLLQYAFTVGSVSNDITPYFPVVSMPSRLNIPTVYTEEEISQLLATVDRGSPIGKRNYAMLLLGVRYGLRSSDIRELKISDLFFEDSQISIIQQKTGKQITFDMLPDVGWALIDYLKNGRPEVKSNCVFLSHKAPFGRFSKNNHLWQVIDKHMRLAGIVKRDGKTTRGFHSLRHSLASNMLNGGIPLTVIKEVLGHENLHTTTMYTKVDVPQLSLCMLEVPL